MPVARYQSQHRRVLCTHLEPELALRFQGSLRLRIQVQPTFSKAFLFSVMSSNIQRPSLFARSECSRAEHHSGFLFQSGTPPRFRVDGGHSPALGATPKLKRSELRSILRPSSAAFAVLAKSLRYKVLCETKQLRRDFKKPTFPSSSPLTPATESICASGPKTMISSWRVSKEKPRRYARGSSVQGGSRSPIGRGNECPSLPGRVS
jgi:hypothetical protein